MFSMESPKLLRRFAVKIPQQAMGKAKEREIALFFLFFNGVGEFRSSIYNGRQVP